MYCAQYIRKWQCYIVAGGEAHGKFGENLHPRSKSSNREGGLKANWAEKWGATAPLAPSPTRLIWLCD